MPDDHRLEQARLEVSQVDSVPGAGLGVQRLPVGQVAAGPAAQVPQRPIPPDVRFRVLGVTLNRNCSALVVGPDAGHAPAERAIATRGRVGCKWKSQANSAAMTGTMKRWCGFVVTHGPQSSLPIIHFHHVTRAAAAN